MRQFLARDFRMPRSDVKHPRELSRQLDSLLKCLSGLFYRCELGPPWTMSFISDGVEDLVGYTAEEISRTTGWAELMHPADVENVEREVDRAVAERRRFSVTYRITHKSGETRWVSEQGHAVYDQDGRPRFLEGVITDVSGREQAEQLQRTLIGRWRKTLDTIPQMVWSAAADSSDEFYNHQWFAFTGTDLTTGPGKSRLDLVHPEDRDGAAKAWQTSLQSGTPYEARYRLQHVSGGYRWVLSRAQAERDKSGRVIRWYGTCTDVHEAVVAQQDLLTHQRFVERLIGASPDSLLLLDEEGRVLFANEVAASAFAREPGKTIVGDAWFNLIPAHLRRSAIKAIAAARRSHATTRFAAQLPSSEDAWWDVIVTPVVDGAEMKFLVTSRDITHQKQAEERANWAANHDALTGLPNRGVLNHRLSAALDGMREPGSGFALLLLDLDDFKRINDELGHDAGDALLRGFADRLRSATRADDVVARLGGDEFAVFLNGVATEAELRTFTEKLFGALKEPLEHEGRQLLCRTSIGAALHPHHGSTGADLLKNADLALYAAKSAERGSMRIFEPALRADAQRRSSMLALAKEALSDDLVVPFYQPKVELQSGAIIGYEALLRWVHPRHGPQEPSSIRAAFDDLSLAAELSERMMQRVLFDMRRWLHRGVTFHHVALNVGAAEFRRDGFADRLLERLQRSEIPHECLQVEITEGVFLSRGASSVERDLTILSEAGVKIALDDFGTGYASLSHLKQFPVHVLKIDQSFVRDMSRDRDDNAIITAILGLGRSLKLAVVAEGVETAAQHQALEALGCRYGQGFLYGRPARELRSSGPQCRSIPLPKSGVSARR